MEAKLGSYQAAVDEALRKLKQDSIVSRIWAGDHTVWRPDPAEISNRLGWLRIADEMAGHTGRDGQIDRLQALAADVKADGFTDVLLLGMGGSSLAPEVFAKTFSADVDGLNLQVLDSTDADAVQDRANSIDLRCTLFIVSTKSGGTVETFSFFKYFYNRVAALVGVAKAGSQFVAITDPGSGLQKVAERYHFRDVFLNNPNIGGRYSALSFFGLVPAALVGVDVAKLVTRAQQAVANAQSSGNDNTSAHLGTIMGVLAKAGRDKVTITASPAIESFGDWVEQLIAESTGKEGKGVLPVVGEPLADLESYGVDRLFVHLRLAGDVTYDAEFEALAAAGQPAVTFQLADKYDLGAHFFLWEMATAVTGHIIDIQPFDQPNVEAAKVLARKMVTEYMEKGRLPTVESEPVTAVALQKFLAQAQPGDYISLQAYVHPTAEADEALLALRIHLRDTYKLATTVGYGPRFLHSTGQLHKGDSGNGLFIQFTSDPYVDADIPDEAGQSGSAMSFGVLKIAQALGDGHALVEAGRRFIRFHLGTDVAGGLRSLLS
ncbi:MAG: glucose-6-phosphate isomerase [Ardenticatenaceae bacterium]|nr:glucose-6-phosphate isomerase [Ardenticatenaceae bacterium]